MRQRLGARRLSLGLVDQAVSSGSNFLLTVTVARNTTPEEFGAFALAWTAYWLALGSTRALICEPLLIRYANAGPARLRVIASRAAGAALVVGVCFSLVCALAAVVFRGAVGPWLLVLAAVLPALLVQDVWRAVFFSRSQPGGALWSDVAWIVIFLPGAALVDGGALGAGTAAMASWGVAGCAAAALGAWKLRVLPSITSPRSWWRHTGPLAGRLLAEFGALSGAGQLAMYALAMIGGLAAAGALRGAQTLLGPLNILFAGLLFTLVPHGVGLARSSPRAVLHLSARISAACAATALAVGLGLAFIPDEAGEALLGSVWPLARDVLLPVTATFAFAGIVFGATAGLRSLADVRRSLRARVLVAPVSVLGVVAGAGYGAFGAAVGLAAAGLVAAVVWWHALSASVADREPQRRLTPTGDPRIAGAD